MFLNPNTFFSNFNYNFSNLLDLRNLQEQVKKHSVSIHCSDLSLFEMIVLVISKFLQILGLQPRISKLFSQSLEQFFLTVGQNNILNKTTFQIFRPLVCHTIPHLFLWFYDQFQWRHLNMADQTKAKELKSRWQMLSLIPIPQWIKFSFFGRSGCPRLWHN